MPQTWTIKFLHRGSGIAIWLASLLTVMLSAGCGSSGRDLMIGIDGLPDTTRPTVAQTQPANDASDVARNAAVSATFSEEMDASMVNPTSFTLTGAVSYANGAKIATFTPAAPALLPPGSTPTATISSAAKDLAGNALASNFIWSFTTAATDDTTRPTVTLTIPATGVNGADPVTTPGDCVGQKPTPKLIACLQPDRRVEVEVFGTR